MTIFLELLTLKVIYKQKRWKLIWFYPRLIGLHIFQVSFKHKDIHK